MAKLKIDIGVVLSSLKTGMNKAVSIVKWGGNQIRKSLNGALGQFVGIAAIGYQFISAMRDAYEFNKQIAEISTMANFSAKEIKNLKSEVNSLAAELGVTSKELNQGIYNALSAGVPKDNVLEFIKIAAKAAVAGVATVDVSVKGLMAVINAYKLPMSAATKVSDIFFKTIKTGVTTFDELANTIGPVLPLAAKMNVSFTQVGAALAAITKQGTSTDMAVTQLRAILSSMTKPSERLAAEIQKIEKSLGGASFMSLSLQKRLELLNDAVNGDNQALAEMFPNIRALVGAMSLVGENGQVATDTLNELANAAGAAGEAFNKMADDSSNKLERANEQIKAMKRELADITMPTLGDAAEQLTEQSKLIRNKDKDKGVKSNYTGAKGVMGMILNGLTGGYGTGWAESIAGTMKGKKGVENIRVDLTPEEKKKLEDRRIQKAGEKTTTPRNEREAAEKIQADKKAKQEEQQKKAEAALKAAKEKEKADKKSAAEAERKRKAEERVNEAIKERIARMNENLKQQRLINDGSEREAFIRKQIASIESAGRKLTDDERKTAEETAGKLYDAQQNKKDAQTATDMLQYDYANKHQLSALQRIGGNFEGMNGRNSDNLLKKNNFTLSSIENFVKNIDKNFNKQPGKTITNRLAR